MKNYITASIFGLAIVIAAFLLGKSYVKKNEKMSLIDVTGLGEEDFTSDLIVWDGEFAVESFNLQEAYSKLQNDKKVVSDYLKSSGINEEEIVFSAVSSRRKTRSNYSADGKFLGEEFSGYSLKQTFKVTSKDVTKIEKISREVTQLLNQGVELYSASPKYYYTKLSELKIKMISKATEDARLRAETIAENSGGKLGDLQSAKMGVFQITGQNSDEEYSWGGTFNTASKNKTASITMKLVYKSQ